MNDIFNKNINDLLDLLEDDPEDKEANIKLDNLFNSIKKGKVYGTFEISKVNKSRLKEKYPEYYI